MSTSAKNSVSTPVDCAKCRARVDGLCAASHLSAAPVVARYKSRDRHVKAGQDVIGIGEPCDAIYNLVEGWVVLYNLLADGRQQILHFGLPGAVLGFEPGGGALATFGVKALTDVVLCVVPRENFGRALRSHPDIGMRLAWLMSRDRSLSFSHLTSIGRHGARERIAHLLLELFIRCRAQWPGHRIEEMHLPLTQEHIGDATGLTGVHVNRVLGGLKRDSIVEFHYRRLRILDPDKLVDAAGIDPHLLLPWTQRLASEQGARGNASSAAMAHRLAAA